MFSMWNFLSDLVLSSFTVKADTFQASEVNARNAKLLPIFLFFNVTL